MLSFKKITKIVGISALAFLAGSMISCGKKSGGGSVATPPANCEAGNTCTVGQSYASGVYFRSGVGQANFGNNQNMLAKLAFYGKDAAGLNMTASPITYRGLFDVTGTIRVADGRYYGVSSTATRMVSGFGFSFEIGLGTPSYSYPRGQDYWYPCGYNDPYCDDGGYQPPPPTCQQYGTCNPTYPNNPGYGNCAIPVGDYAVTTIQSGTWNSGYNYGNESFTNLKIRFVYGGTTVDATFSQGSLQNSQYNNATTTGTSILRGRMVINSVNNVQCNQTVQF